jgi:hypothetical protein
LADFRSFFPHRVNSWICGWINELMNGWMKNKLTNEFKKKGKI